SHYSRPLASLYIGLARNGQVVLRGSDRPSEASIAAASEFWSQHPAAVPDSWVTGPFHTTPLLVRGKVEGGVGVVVPESWEQLVGWKMVLTGVGLLLAGTGIAAAFIFGGVRR